MSPLEGLGAWNRACELAVRTCSATAGCIDDGFRDQLTRTSLAVPTTIADGYERRASTAVFRDRLEAAKGRCAELRTRLYIAAQLDLIPLQSSTELMQASLELSRQLDRLIEACGAEPDPG